MMLEVATVCRCGTERVVRHGGIVHCSHCDNPCSGGNCGFCAQLAVTCNDCRTVHRNVQARAKCESLHANG